MTTVAEPTALDVTPVKPLVNIRQRENWMGAFRPVTGALLATAERRGSNEDDEWVGWAIQAPGRKPVIVMTRALARHMVEEFALDAVGGAR